MKAFPCDDCQFPQASIVVARTISGRKPDLMDTLFAFLAAALALIASPEPNILSLAGIVSGYRRRRGLPYKVDLNIGMALVILLTGSGVSAAVLALPLLKPLIIVAAVVYFLLLAFKIATAPPIGEGQTIHCAPRWQGGVLIFLMNPKTYAAMGAMFPARLSLHCHL